ncbi:MAG: hypothetical protein AAFU67_16820, partial [Bacteroidota bacterium]
MKFVFTYLLPFIIRHWLRLAILGSFLFLMTKKQVGFDIQLGKAPRDVPPELYSGSSSATAKSG